MKKIYFGEDKVFFKPKLNHGRIKLSGDYRMMTLVFNPKGEGDCKDFVKNFTDDVILLLEKRGFYVK